MKSLERWRDVVDYVGLYQVSDFGRVRSLDRIIEHPQGPMKIKGRILKPSRGCRQYLFVILCKQGHRKTKHIHTLVLETFIGPRPKDMECCHGPDGSLVNHVSNLSWGTRFKNNVEDKRRDGILQNRRVRRSDGKEFESLRLAARQNNCSHSNIGRVCRGEYKTVAGYGWEYVK